ncbi:MAG: hypothetical protein VYB54_00850 [Pseudomonadota bacterium]|nr:hypothetical protein [Pseudomonadota bacterium]
MITLRHHHRWLVPVLLLVLALPLLAAAWPAQRAADEPGAMATLHTAGHCDGDVSGQEPSGAHRTACGLLLPCDHGGCASAIVPVIAAAESGLPPLPRLPRARDGIDRLVLPATPPPRPLA